MNTYASAISEADGDPGSSAVIVESRKLLRNNSLVTECMLALARSQPVRFLGLMPRAISLGRFPHEALDIESNLDVTVLPYDAKVLGHLYAEKAKGNRIEFAADQFPATVGKIAQHLSLRDDAEAHAPAMLPQVAAASARSAMPDLHAWFKALRVHQWIKNLLLFVPLAASHQLADPIALVSGLLAFLCFGLMASGVYVLNDLLDLADDRHHPTKRHRPFASGRISVVAGLGAIPVFTTASLVLAILLPFRFSMALIAYLVLTLAYSLTLKRRMAVDVVALAGLYTLRIVAGGFAVGVALSFWLLAFSMFLFLSLALVKRYAELFQFRALGMTEKARGRGYWPADLDMIASLGGSAGYMAVMVLALYVNDANTSQMYAHPKIIWFACPILLMWISRVWMLANRGHMNEDPVLFATRDRVSLLLGLLLACVFWAAT